MSTLHILVGGGQDLNTYAVAGHMDELGLEPRSRVLGSQLIAATGRQLITAICIRLIAALGRQLIATVCSFSQSGFESPLVKHTPTGWGWSGFEFEPVCGGWVHR